MWWLSPPLACCRGCVSVSAETVSGSDCDDRRFWVSSGDAFIFPASPGDHIAAVRTISTNESPVSPQATQARIGGFARSAHSSHARFISSFCAMSVIKTKAVRIRPLMVPTSAKFPST